MMPPSCDTHALPFDTADIGRCFASPPPPGTPPHLAMWASLGRAINELVLQQSSTVFAVARDSGGVAGVVASYLMRPLGLILADKLGVPLTVVQLQPQVPTACFPHHVQPKLTAAAIIAEAPPKDEYMQAYVDLEALLYSIFSEKMNVLRKDLGLPVLAFGDFVELSKGNNPTVLVANAYPLALVSRVPADYGPMVRHCGPLADSYVHSDKTVDEAEVEDAVRVFLAAGVAPVCVGLGSMPVSPEVCRKVIAALKDAGVERAVFVGGASGLGIDAVPLDSTADENLCKLREWMDGQTISVKSISYTWLLPQCSMMLCHGGAGVVSATLRAGIPAVIMPLVFDQFMWGQLVEDRGFGVFVGTSVAEASPSALVAAIKRARSSELLRSACDLMGKDLQNGEAGADKLVDLLIHHNAQAK